MENTKKIVCKILYNDHISNRDGQVLGEIYQSDLDGFDSNDNSFIMPRGTSHLINKNDIKMIVVYREAKKYIKMKGNSTLYHSSESDIGRAAF